MTQPIEHVDYLSRDIGARTAGTDEERQAALYIADEFQSDSGFHTEIEDFVSSSNLDLLRPVCAIVVFAAGILALLFPVLCIPALILTVLAAVVYVTELLDKPIVPQSLARVASQNVVAKYQPNPPQEGRRKRTRKIVLVARYDTGSVRSGFDRMIRSKRLPIAWISIASMALAVIFSLIRLMGMANATGFGALVFNILNILVLIVAVVPAVLAFMNRRAGLNEGANNNATGVAALLEVARRISRGSLSEADLSDSEVRMHGEQALLDEGLVPEGAQMVYESGQLLPPDLEPQTPEERLAKAKAALAAFTGVPGARYEPTDIAAHLVNTREGFAEPPAYDREPEASDEFQREGQDAYGTGGSVAAGSPFGHSEPFADYDADTRDVAPAEFQKAPAYDETAAGSNGAPAYEPAPVEARDSNIMDWSSITEQAGPSEVQDDAGTSDRFENAPAWFVAAQKKARRSDEEGEVRPSRYGSAISAAEREIEQRAREEEEAAAERERERLREAVAAAAAQAEAEAAARAEAEAAAQAEAEAAARAEEEAAAQERERASEPVEDRYVPIAVAALNRDEVRANSYHRSYGNDPEDAYGKPRPLSADSLPSPLGAEARGAAAAPVAEPAEDAAYDDGLRSNDGAAAGDVPIDETPAGAYADAGGYDDEPQAGDWRDEDARNASFEHPMPPAEQDAADHMAAGAEVAPRRRPIVLPDIGDAPSGDSQEADGLSRSGMIRRLRTDIPSLSGSVAPAGVEEKPADAAPVGRIGATGSFAPVGEELMAKADEDDMYIDDADDSNIEENYTETGAYAGPDYVEMPKSRFGRLFGRKKKKADRNNLNESPQEWLDVDEGFDARQEGKRRGDWESFRPDDYDKLPQDQPKERMRDLLHDNQDGYDDNDEYGDGFDDYDDAPRRRPRGGRRWEGGAFSRVRLGRVDARSEADQDEELPPEEGEFGVPGPERGPEREQEQDLVPIEQIYHFRNPNFNTEVWFVAIGSDTRRHDGIKAFIDEHRADLRGALVLEVESLGSGELCLIQEEGLFKRQTASSRIRRLLKKTAAAIGYEPGQASISNADSLTSVAVSKGIQTMHLAGMDGDWPALKGSAGDTAENIDEELLLSNIDYITELVQRF